MGSVIGKYLFLRLKSYGKRGYPRLEISNYDNVYMYMQFSMTNEHDQIFFKNLQCTNDHEHQKLPKSLNEHAKMNKF